MGFSYFDVPAHWGPVPESEKHPIKVLSEDTDMLDDTLEEEPSE